MKRLALVTAVLILAAGSVFAQSPQSNGARGAQGNKQWGTMGGIDWKLGTVVLIEDKKLTGQLVLNERLTPVLKVDGIEYLLILPRRADSQLNVKNGDTMTVEGLVVTEKSDATKIPRIIARKVTINGVETNLRQHRAWGHRPMSGSMRGSMGDSMGNPGQQ